MSINSTERSWNLVADIGGTNARFALNGAPLKYENVGVFKSTDFDNLDHALRHYLHTQGNPAIQHAVIAIANPILGDHVKMTNAAWEFSIKDTQAQLGFKALDVINDFTALALSIPFLSASDLVKVGGTHSNAVTALGLLGPGTGLGVSALIPRRDGGWTPIAGEGGHVSFAPSNDRELILWREARSRFDHVSLERLLSGSGLQFIYQTFSRLAGHTPNDYTPADISQHAIETTCPHCREALDTFCAILGTAAANTALTFGARSGVYLGGGIVPRLGDYFLHSPFRERFEHKGRFSNYLSSIPVFIITSHYPGLLGAAAFLDSHVTA